MERPVGGAGLLAASVCRSRDRLLSTAIAQALNACAPRGRAPGTSNFGRDDPPRRGAVCSKPVLIC